jgi:hypothetical protein
MFLIQVPEIDFEKRTALREKFSDILSVEEDIVQGKAWLLVAKSWLTEWNFNHFSINDIFIAINRKVFRSVLRRICKPLMTGLSAQRVLLYRIFLFLSVSYTPFPHPTLFRKLASSRHTSIFSPNESLKYYFRHFCIYFFIFLSSVS